MKKIIALVLALILTLSLITITACEVSFGNSGGESGDNSNAGNNNNNNNNNGGNNSNNNGGNNGGNNGNNNNSGTGLAGSLRASMASAFASGTIHFKMRSVNEAGEMIYEMYMKNGMIATMMDINGMITRSITKDGMVYSLYDDYKKYSETEIYDEETNIFADLFDEDTDDTYKLVSEGSMDFMGKTCKYEEFFDNDTNERVWYFFDNNGVLAGMRSIDEDGETQETEVLAFDQNIPNSVFDLPSDYTEASYDDLMVIMQDMFSYGDDWDDWDDWDWGDDDWDWDWD